jgi:uncharacterized protein YkwD
MRRGNWRSIAKSFLAESNLHRPGSRMKLQRKFSLKQCVVFFHLSGTRRNCAMLLKFVVSAIAAVFLLDQCQQASDAKAAEAKAAAKAGANEKAAESPAPESKATESKSGSVASETKNAEAKSASAESTTAKATEADPNKKDLIEVEKQIVEKTNTERARYGLPPLVVDRNLIQSARTHAAWMTNSRSLQHTNKPVAENIAMGQRTSDEALSSWMGSSGHRANILNGDHKRIGVAAYRTPDGTIYWCQQFLP